MASREIEAFAPEERNSSAYSQTQVLYEAAGGNLHQGVFDEELALKLDMNRQEFQRHAVYLREEGLVKFQTLSSISLSHAGRKEAERIVEEAYSQKERRVLETIADMSRMSRLLVYADVQKRLDMPRAEFRTI